MPGRRGWEDFPLTPRAEAEIEALERIAEFDHVFVVTEAGTLEDATGLWAPDVYHIEGGRAPDDIEIGGGGWEALTGYTGQYGYHGACMHASEYLGGALAEDILNTPGTYVLVIVEVHPDDDDEDPEPAGWAVLRRTTR